MITVLGGDAGYPSDLVMTYPTQRTLKTDATGFAGQVKDVDGAPLVIAYPLSQSIDFGIYTPAYGTTHTSSSQYGKVRQEAEGSWLVCFEDDGDSDFDDLVIRVTDFACGHEHLTNVGTESDTVRVRYDPRSLGEPGVATMVNDADILARAIRDRATSALTDPQTGYAHLYGAFGQAGDVPAHVDIDILCGPRLLLISPVERAATDGPDHVMFNAAYLRPLMQDYLDQVHNNAAAQVAGEPWADTVDHELMHTMQGVAWSRQTNLLAYAQHYLGGGAVKFESTAQAAEDYFADVDDFLPGTGIQDTKQSSFLRLLLENLLNHDSLLQDDYHETKSYEFDGFFQYLGERFGTQTQADLEARVAEFNRRIYLDDASDVLESIANAIGGSRADVLDALRDYYLTLYVRQAANAISLPSRLRILDETTSHLDTTPSYGAPIPGQSWGELKLGGDPNHVEWNAPITANIASTDVELPKTHGLVLGFTPAANTAAIQVTITNTSVAEPNVNDVIRLGFAGIGGANHDQAVVSPASFELGPLVGNTQTYMIPAAGLSRVGLVIVGGASDSSFRLKVDFVLGSLALSVDGVVPVTTSDDSVVVHAHASVGSFAARYMPADVFTASIDGVGASVKSTFDLSVAQSLVIVPGAPLSAGSHTLSVTFTLGAGTATASTTFNVTAGGGMAALSSSSAVKVAAIEATSVAGGGTPIAARIVLAQAGVGVAGATVVATVTDPLGTVRHFALSDAGGEYDSGWQDGAYGAPIRGTNAAGTYTVTVDATGVDASGTPYALTASTTVLVGSMQDSDGDGVANSVETAFGLDPNNPSDGSRDIDADGLGTGAELALGSDPLNADTDGASEPDGSEFAAGRDPLATADDHAVGIPHVFVEATDGRHVAVTLVAFTGSTQVHLYRDSASTSVDLGLKPADGSVFVEGPLVAGSYSYRVVGVGADGALSQTGISPAVTARDDASAPSGFIAINAGSGLTSSAAVNVAFSGLSETPSTMRIAQSREVLLGMAFTPFAASSTVSLDATSGPHILYAQLADAAGNVSNVMVASISLDLAPPTSTAGPLPSSSVATGIAVPYVASDDIGIAHVELWSRYRQTPSASWGAWTRQAVGTASPIWSTFGPQGDYQYSTIAMDVAGNREQLPAIADASIHVGPEFVNDDTGTADQRDSRATIGLDGKVYAVWRDARNSASIYDVYFSKRDATAGTWSANQRADDSTFAVTSPALAVDATGNAYAIWVDSRRGDADIWFSKRSVTTGIWSASVRVNDDAAGSSQSAPAIAVSSTGEAIATWVDERSHKVAIYSARLPSGGGTWSANFKSSSDTALSKSGPDIAIGPGGLAYAVWSQVSKQGLSSVRFASLPLGSTVWSADVLVSDAALSQLGGHIRADTAGDLVLTGQLGSNSVWARYRLAGSQTWSALTYVASTSNAFSNSLSMRGNGVAYVTWADINNQVYGSRWDPSTHTWSAQQQLTFTGPHFYPSVALDSVSAVVVTADLVGTYDIRAYPTVVP